MTKQEVAELSAQKLAYVGDAVHTLYVREQMLGKEHGNMARLSRRSNRVCNAAAQEKAYFLLLAEATEEEKAIAMRGRNATLHHSAKNFSIESYRHATAYEAVIGYLYLTNQTERLGWALALAQEEQ